MDLLMKVLKKHLDGITFKLTHNGMSKCLKSFVLLLKKTKQQVVFNQKFSTIKNVSAGVPQGFILNLLLFLLIVNGFSECLSTNSKVFVDNTSPFSI